MLNKKALKCRLLLISFAVAILLLALITGTVFGLEKQPPVTADIAHANSDYVNAMVSLEPEAGQRLLYLLTEKDRSAFLKSHNSDQQMIRDYAVSANRVAAVGLNRETVDAGALAPGDSFIIDVSEDRQYLVTVEHVNFDRNTTSIRGRVAESFFGFFHMTSSGGQTMAVLRIPEENRVYHITCSISGHYHLYEFAIDEFEQYQSLPPRIPQEEKPLSPEENKQVALKSTGDRQILSGNPADPTTIDVMVVYTPAARDWAGGTAAMNNIINQALLRAQEANDNSNTGITMRLVHSAEVDFIESGSISWDLNYLTYQGNDEMDIVHTWRDQYGADLVALFTEGNQGGISWLFKGPRWDADQTGFSVSNINKVATTYLVIHEMGHNLGAHHHKQQSHQPGPNSDLNNYSAGWRFLVDSTWYSTVMSYYDGFFFGAGTPGAGITSIEVGYFSTPLINYPGSSIAIGHAEDGDNARTLRETKHHIAAFRSSGTNYTLTVNSTNPFSGVEIDSGTGHGGTTFYSLSLGEGTSVTLTAPEYHGSGAERKHFDSWSGAVSGTIRTINLTMSENRTVTANYVDDPEDTSYTLTVNSTNPASGVEITSSTGHGGTTSYTLSIGDGTSVTLTAPEFYGSGAERKRFDSWSGAVTGANRTINLTMSENRMVTANYVDDPEVTSYSLTVNSTNPGSGVVITSSTGHGGTTSYTLSLGEDTSVTLTAPEFHGSGAERKRFDSWSGAVSGTIRTINLTMSANRMVTANYVDDPEVTSYSLTVNSTNPGSGVVINSSTGHGGITSYTRSLGEATSVTLTAPEHVGSGSDRKRFDNWSGAVTDTNRTINFTMNANRTLTANYVDGPELSGGADLSALTVNPGSLSPVFAPATTTYTVAVGLDTSSINITATLADENATLTLGGAAATSGVAKTVNLGAAGTSTPVAIVVTAADGTTEKTYRVNINRAGATSTAIPKYIFYENEDGDLVRADYQKAEEDLFKPNPDRRLLNAIKEALIRAFQDRNRRAIYVADESGRVIDYYRAASDGLSYIEAYNSSDYWVGPLNPVKELIINPQTGSPEEREL